MITLLHVEDNELDARALERALKKLGLTLPVFWVRDGVEALELLRKTHPPNQVLRPNIILLDINMPRMNGLEFLAELRKDAQLRHIPVIVLTTSDNASDIAAAYAHNVAGYIVKPVGTDQLAERLNAVTEFLSILELPRTA